MLSSFLALRDTALNLVLLPIHQDCQNNGRNYVWSKSVAGQFLTLPLVKSTKTCFLYFFWAKSLQPQVEVASHIGVGEAMALKYIQIFLGRQKARVAGGVETNIVEGVPNVCNQAILVHRVLDVLSHVQGQLQDCTFNLPLSEVQLVFLLHQCLLNSGLHLWVRNFPFFFESSMLFFPYRWFLGFVFVLHLFLVILFFWHLTSHQQASQIWHLTKTWQEHLACQSCNWPQNPKLFAPASCESPGHACRTLHFASQKHRKFLTCFGGAQSHECWAGSMIQRILALPVCLLQLSFLFHWQPCAACPAQPHTPA